MSNDEIRLAVLKEVLIELDRTHPYKQTIFPNTRGDIVKLLRDKGLNDAELTSTSGVLARLGYEVAIHNVQALIDEILI